MQKENMMPPNERKSQEVYEKIIHEIDYWYSVEQKFWKYVERKIALMKTVK